MGFFSRDPVLINEGGSAAPGAPPPSGNVIHPGAYNIDVGYLNALYGAGKLTPAQRTAILGGSDPSGMGLSSYDLYYLTDGALGNNSTVTTAGLSLIPAYNAASSYPQYQLVTFQPPGCQNAALYQAVQAVPANGASIAGGAAINALPTNTAYWTQLTNPGPVVLYDADVLNPALASAAGVASVPSTAETDGTALAALTIPAGRRYKILELGVHPAVAGGAMPADQKVDVDAYCVEVLNADGSVTLTVTPRWYQFQKAAVSATSSGNSYGAVGAGTLVARLRIELQ